MDVKEVTFNDMPQVIGKIFQKIEHVEQMLNNMKAELDDNLISRPHSYDIG